VAALQSAVAKLQSGQTIVIEPGTYNLTNTLYVGSTSDVTNVTIRGATDNYSDVTLLGAGMENPKYGNVAVGISVQNGQNVTIADLSIGEVWFHPIQLHAARGANDIHIYHDRLFNAGEQFIKSDPGGANGGVDNSTVLYTVMEYTNRPPALNHGGGTGYTNGVDVHTGSGWVIENNLFQNMYTPDGDANLWNPAVLVWNHSSNATVEGNTFINVDRAIALGLSHQTPGFDNQGGIIANNFVYMTPGLFSASRKAGSDAPIIAWNSPDTLIYANTILTNGNTFNSIQTRWISGDDLENNLTDATFRGRDGSTFTQGGNFVKATPAMFVNPAAGNLNLLINAATQASVLGKAPALAAVPADWNGNTRPTANNDIGADQVTGVGIDLNWAGGGITGPTALDTSQPFQINRTYTIIAAASVRSFTITYFASPFATFGREDMVVGSELILGAGLTPGMHAGVSPNLYVDANGPLYLYAKLDSGNVVTETNKANNVAVAPQVATATGPVIVVNGRWGYHETGSGWFTVAGGYSGKVREHDAGTGADTATWQVTGLTSGQYTVQAFWPASGSAASNSTYKIYDGATLLATVVVNQKNAPAGPLGTFLVTSGTVSVVLSDNANGTVIADAIRVSAATPSIAALVTVSPPYAPNGQTTTVNGLQLRSIGVPVNNFFRAASAVRAPSLSMASESPHSKRPSAQVLDQFFTTFELND
jgi:hypothetical protein